MDPVTLLVTALAAGAAAGVGETATMAVKDAYATLKERVAARFSGDTSREVVLAGHERQPEVWCSPLARALIESGAVEDQGAVEAAQRLLELLDEAGARQGRYVVDVRGAQGVQVGDHNSQINRFG
ncbi:MAG: hypothetical protein QG671_1519 [Actinomycetota bacterium]|nr:hypothetical protein [Actinomycetota bacterium]